MLHTHLLDELMDEALAHQDADHEIAYAHQWYGGVYVQIMLIGAVIAIYTIGTMMPEELPLVTDDFDIAAAKFDELMQQSEVF